MNLEFDVDDDQIDANKLGGDASDLTAGEGGMVQALRDEHGIAGISTLSGGYDEMRQGIINEQRYLAAIYPAAPLASPTSALEVQRACFQVRTLKVLVSL